MIWPKTPHPHNGVYRYNLRSGLSGSTGFKINEIKGGGEVYSIHLFSCSSQVGAYLDEQRVAPLVVFAFETVTTVKTSVCAERR